VREEESYRNAACRSGRNRNRNTLGAAHDDDRILALADRGVGGDVRRSAARKTAARRYRL